MFTMKHLLLTTIAALVLVGCGNEDKQRNKLGDEDTFKELVKGHRFFNNLKMDVSSKYMQSDMYLKFKIYPYTVKSHDHNVKFFDKIDMRVSLRDAANFEIYNLTVAYNDFKYNRDDAGEYLELDQKIGFNRGMYDKIKSATVKP